jgi:hypothetical protein
VNRAERRRAAALERKGRAKAATRNHVHDLAAYDEVVRRSGLGHEEFRRFATSIHEAGHGVVARAIGIEVESCNIGSVTDSGVRLSGYTDLAPSKDVRPDGTEIVTGEDVKMRVVFGYAGEEAEKRAGIYVMPEEHDRLHIEEMLAQCPFDDNLRAEIRKGGQRFAANFVRDGWDSILAVAKELRERGRVTGDEIDAIIKRTGGVMPDEIIEPTASEKDGEK